MFPWTDFWAARNPRERAVIAWGGVLLGVLLIYSFLWVPLESDHARLRASVPALLAQSSQFDIDAAEAARLKKAAGARVTDPVSPAALEAAAERVGMRQSVKSIAELAGGRLQVTLDPVPYEALMQWIGEVSTSGGLGVESLQLRRGATPGKVAVSNLVFKGGGS